MAESRQERNAETALPPTIQNLLSSLCILNGEGEAESDSKWRQKTEYTNIVVQWTKTAQVTYLKAPSGVVEQVP